MLIKIKIIKVKDKKEKNLNKMNDKKHIIDIIFLVKIIQGLYM